MKNWTHPVIPFKMPLRSANAFAWKKTRCLADGQQETLPFRQCLKGCCLLHLRAGLFKQTKTPENTGNAYSFCPACPAPVSILMQANTFASEFHGGFTPEGLFSSPSLTAAPRSCSHNLILCKTKTKDFFLLLALTVSASQGRLSEQLTISSCLIIS